MDITKSLIHELLPAGLADITTQSLLGEKPRKPLQDMLTDSQLTRSELFGVLANMAVTEGYGVQTLGVFKALEELRDEEDFKPHFTIGENIISAIGPDYTQFAPNSLAGVCLDESAKGFINIMGTQNMLFSKGSRNQIILSPIWLALAVVRGDGNRIDSIGDFSIIKVSGNDNEINVMRGGVINISGAGNTLLLAGLDHIHLGLYFKASVGTVIQYNGFEYTIKPKDSPIARFEPDTWYYRGTNGRIDKADKLPLIA